MSQRQSESITAIEWATSALTDLDNDWSKRELVEPIPTIVAGLKRAKAELQRLLPPSALQASLIGVAGYNAAGQADLVAVELPQAHGIDDTQCSVLARKAAGATGLVGPLVVFPPSRFESLLAGARSLGLVPSVVVVDASGGVFEKASVDAGHLEVVVFDASDECRGSDSGRYLPLDGPDSPPTHCWADILEADASPDVAAIYAAVLQDSDN